MARSEWRADTDPIYRPLGRSGRLRQGDDRLVQAHRSGALGAFSHHHHPSPNRWLQQVEPYADEIWNLPDLMPGAAFPEFILGFIESRKVPLVHIMNHGSPTTCCRT